MIKIVKASAGSGKTYTLAKTYIRLLLTKQDRYAYRHILAVTFTNKATDEMKSRIMRELFILATNPEKSPYAKEFSTELSLPLESLQKTADEVLSNILHDYGAFSISTIDRFFQQTLKAFSKEIGQFASYQVELDKNALVQESVDRILDALTEENADTVKWLIDSVLEQLEKGGRYELESALVKMAVRLKSDEHRQKIESFHIDENKAYSKENLLKVRDICREVIDDFEFKLRQSAERAIEIFTSAGLNADDFNRKFVNVLYDYRDFESGTVLKRPTESFFAKATDHEQWFAKSKAVKFKALVYPFLEAPLADFCELFDADYKVYRTAHTLWGQLYSLGVAGDLYREFKALMKEKNVLSIDDSNTILRDIIDGSDTPFVYEKLGVRFENFLLDEFQDTSRIQWENFYPLLKESNDNNNENLIVGDVKQSIYRWRGSDWNLMSSEVQTAFGDVRLETLDKNFRSCRNVINFNNSFFGRLAAELDAIYADGQGREIGQIYEDVEQKYPEEEKKGRNEPAGQVKLNFCDKDNEISVLLSDVKEAQRKGFRLSDIAVLVRSNNDGKKVATSLIDAGIKVITDDSLKVKSSVTVRRLVSLLSYIDNPTDMISGYLAASLDIDFPDEYHSLLDLSESLIRELKKKDDEGFEREVLYVQSFMDCLDDYARVHGNSLHAFLKYWEDADPAISSPSAEEAVTVMTIHKSKGLDFRYVILPFAENINLFKADSYWCMPETEGTAFSGAEKAVYDVRLSSESEDTLFADDYRKELKKQYIDNINILYVAMTRAKEVLHIIAKHPSKAVAEYLAGGQWVKFSDFSQALHMFAKDSYAEAGLDVQTDDDVLTYVFDSFPLESPMPVRSESPKTIPASVLNDESALITIPLQDHSTSDDTIMLAYPSWSINTENNKRLILSTASSDFFSEDGETGIKASQRIRGVVLHDILSRVLYAEDLEKSIQLSYISGDINAEEAAEIKAFLSERIGNAVARGWFAADSKAVYNEMSLIDTDGEIYRPDRVEIKADGEVLIIDYKFGEHRKAYEKQVAKYADIYRRMGYPRVTPALWYLLPDIVR